MLKQLLEKKNRKRNGDVYTYYGMPAMPYFSPHEFRQGYAGDMPSVPPIHPQGIWPTEGVYPQQMYPYEGTMGYQPFYHNQLYQQPSVNPYFTEQFPGTMPVSAGMPDNYYGIPQQEMLNQYPKEPVNPFQNPLYTSDEDYYPAQQANSAVTHPYPKQSFMQKNQGGNISSVLNQFKTQEGSIDFNKMIDTAGMMLNSMNQVSNLVKGVGSIFKVTT